MRFHARSATKRGASWLVFALSLQATAAESDAAADSSETLVAAPETPTPDVTPEASIRDASARDRNAPGRARGALPERVDVITLTVSGAVSLGSYEAGQLYFLIDSLSRSPDPARVLVATGASAGSANAMISATEACQKRPTLPEESLGYRVWIPVGLGELFRPDRTVSNGLFVRDGMEAGFSTLTAEWRRGLPESCDFVVAIAATREKGLDVQLADGLIAPRQSERFVFRVRGRKDQLPVFSNYVEPNQSFERPLLPFSEGTDITGDADFEAVREATLASTAFPIAFSPQPVSHCLTRPDPKGAPPSKRPPVCLRPTRRDTFLDGGVFDNNPLGTAYRIARDGLVRADDGARFRDAPTGGPEGGPEVLHAFIDPDLARYPVFTPGETKRRAADPLVDILSNLGGQMLSTARGQQLVELTESNPDALERLWLVESHFPPIGGLLGAFFGFFEKDFRDFDFYLGTYDSFTELRAPIGGVVGAAPAIRAWERTFAGPRESVPSSHRKLACLLGHFEPKTYGHLRPLCGGDALRNFRVLLQVSIDRLWSNCRRVDPRLTERAGHAFCSRARAGALPPAIDPTFRVRGDRFQTTYEGDFDYSIRLLADYGFHFRDLGLDADDAGRARLVVRRKLAEMVDALADVQPDFEDRTLVLTGGRAVVNSIQYEPPVFRAYALLGTSIAGGILQRFFDMHVLYWNADLRLNNFRTLVTDRATMFGATASAGFEWSLFPLSGSVLQSSVGLRAGYQMSGNDAFGTDPCPAEGGLADPRNCSQLVLHAPLNVTLLERVRFNLTPLFYPVPESFGHRVFDLEFGIGAVFF